MRFPLPPVLRRRGAQPLLFLGSVLLLSPVFFFLLLFRALPPTDTLVETFRHRGPRDIFCGLVLRRYRAQPPGTASAPPPHPSPPRMPRKQASRVTGRELIERGPTSDAAGGLVGGGGFVGGGSGGAGVPRLLHQSWMVSALPGLYARFAGEWREELGEDWEWVLWTDTDNLLLVQTLYPDLLDLYNSFPTEIYRADFVRNLYMHAFGGMYVDLDSSPLTLAPLLTLFQTYSPPHIPFDPSDPTTTNPYTARPVAYLGQMDTAGVDGGSEALTGEKHEIPNAWMASQKGHPFWVGQGGPVDRARRGMRVGARGTDGAGEGEGKGRGWGKSPEWITGPITLRQSYLSYHNITSVPSSSHTHSSLPSPSPSPSHSHSHAPPLSLLAPLILLPPPHIYPYAWTSESNDLLSCTCSLQTRFFDEGWCKALLIDNLEQKGKGFGGRAYFVSFWGHSWGGWEGGKKVLGWVGLGKARDEVSPFAGMRGG